MVKPSTIHICERYVVLKLRLAYNNAIPLHWTRAWTCCAPLSATNTQTDMPLHNTATPKHVYIIGTEWQLSAVVIYFAQLEFLLELRIGLARMNSIHRQQHNTHGHWVIATVACNMLLAVHCALCTKIRSRITIWTMLNCNYILTILSSKRTRDQHTSWSKLVSLFYVCYKL